MLCLVVQKFEPLLVLVVKDGGDLTDVGGGGPGQYLAHHPAPGDQALEHGQRGQTLGTGVTLASNTGSSLHQARAGHVPDPMLNMVIKLSRPSGKARD